MYVNLGLFVLLTDECRCIRRHIVYVFLPNALLLNSTKPLSLESHRWPRGTPRLIIKVNYDEDDKTSYAIHDSSLYRRSPLLDELYERF